MQNFKFQVLNAIIRTKRLYGLDSAQLSNLIMNKFDTFQLEGPMKILRMQTTYVNRGNTNAGVIETANILMESAGNTQTHRAIFGGAQKIKNSRVRQTSSSRRE